MIDLILLWLGTARAALYAIFTEAQQIFTALLCGQSYIADMKAMDLVGSAEAGPANQRKRSPYVNHTESLHIPTRAVNFRNCLTAAWQRSSSAHATAMRRELGGRPVKAPAVPVSVRRLHPHRMALRLGVEESDILKARKAILCACGDVVEMLQCTRIRGTSRMCLRVTFEDNATAQTLHHVMQRLAAGDFGRVAVL